MHTCFNIVSTSLDMLAPDQSTSLENYCMMANSNSMVSKNQDEESNACWLPSLQDTF